MSAVLDHLEAAIGEVTKARASTLRGSTQQVRSTEETGFLKAVALAWFQTHRPHVVEMATNVDAVDAPYRQVLEATSRAASRATYAGALKDAKTALVALRTSAATGRGKLPSSTSDAPPAFALLAPDATMQAILNRRWAEVQLCIHSGANLAATVMMGGLLETLLVARINVTTKKAAIFTAKAAPRDKTTKQPLPLSDWKLVNMVEIAHELEWITRSAKDVGNVLREFRNYIHPHKEHTDGVHISQEDARMFWEVCKAISRQVIASL